MHVQLGAVAAPAVTGQINDPAGTALTPKYALLNQAASGTAQTLPVVRVDDTDALVSEDSSGSSEPGGLHMGCVKSESVFAHCTVNELLIYGADVSGGDRAAVQDYLKSKWGTP